MDKLRLYTPHRGAITPYIKELYFRCTGKKYLPNGLQVYFYYDEEAGVSLTHSPNFITLEVNPTRYLNGNNYKQIDREGLARFAEQLSERYQTELHTWDVSLFYYNADLEVNEAPAKYFADFGRLKKWTVKTYERESVLYSTKSNSKAFNVYDLHRRCRKDKTPIPPEMEGKKIIRMEASFNSELPKIKELKNMRTLSDYLQPDNYAKLPQLWLELYELIEKNEPLSTPPDLTKSEADMLAAIEKHSLNGYREMIRKEYPSIARYQLQKVEALMQKVRAHQQTKLVNRIAELNYKVKERASQLIMLYSNRETA